MWNLQSIEISELASVTGGNPGDIQVPFQDDPLSKARNGENVPENLTRAAVNGATRVLGHLPC